MILRMFFLLICVHALTDFQLQNGGMWKYKIRGRSCWYHWLTAHALICGGGVYLATQCLTVAICEVVCHWLTDFCKGEGWIDFETDQVFHIACRIIYVIILWGAGYVYV